MDHVNPYAATTETFQDHFSDSELATRSQRFLGALLDGFLQMIIAGPVGFALGTAIGVALGPGLATQVVASIVGGVMGFGIFMALNGYFLATQGKTIGKLAVGTRIVDRDTGQLVPLGPLVLKRYVWLWIVSLIPIVNYLVAITNALLIFRENRACLHDDLANTKVIVDSAFEMSSMAGGSRNGDWS